MASYGCLVSQLFYHLDNQLPGLDSLCLDTCSFKASLQRYLLNYKKKRRTTKMRSPSDTTLNQVIKDNIICNKTYKHHGFPCIMPWEGPCHSWGVLAKNAHCQSGNPNWWNFQKINDLQKCQGCRDKKRPQECHRLEENKKARQLDANSDLGTEKGH